MGAKNRLRRVGQLLLLVSSSFALALICMYGFPVISGKANAETVPVVMDESGMIVSGNGEGTYVEEFKVNKNTDVLATTSHSSMPEMLSLVVTKICESKITVIVTVCVFIFAVVCLTLSRKRV